jgi:hypothetical protein
MTVIGPIDGEWWNTLRMIKGSINWYEERNHTGKYDTALKKERECYRFILDKYKENT